MRAQFCLVLVLCLLAEPAAAQERLVKVTNPTPEAVDWFEMRVNTGAFVNVGKPAPVEGAFLLPVTLADGTYTFTVRGCNAGGCALDSVPFVKTLGTGVPTPPPPPPSSGPYLGYFKDVAGARDLRVAIYDSGSMTPKQCMDMARAKGYRYAGIREGYRCSADSRYGTYGPADPVSVPHIICTGNRKPECGGMNANDVYDTAQ